MGSPFRVWFLPSWMGLDAPFVVSTWTWAVARASGETWHFLPASGLFLVVWAIYLSDRLIDVAQCHDWDRATGRLRFGRRFRPLFVACLALCLAALAVVAALGVPEDVIRRAALVACGVAAHFVVFVLPVVFRDKLPGKELGVGLFFALGGYACIGGIPGDIPLFFAVALVVAYNCLVIAARDAEADRANDPGNASRWWVTMPRDLLLAGAALTFASGLYACLDRRAGFFAAAALAFAALTVLHMTAHRLSGDAVRSLADFALFTPPPVFAVFSMLNAG